jgi:hypothetical protein
VPAAGAGARQVTSVANEDRDVADRYARAGRDAFARSQLDGRATGCVRLGVDLGDADHPAADVTCDVDVEALTHGGTMHLATGGPPV